jgi:predicted nuclease of predicted toxin-antitoxin system
VKFLVDNQLPTALAQYLRQRGFDCEHVLDIGLAQASDIEICRYAEAQDRTIVSKDEDFFYLASQPETNIRLLWVRLGNCRTKALVEAFERFWPMIESWIEAGDRIIEIR